MEYIYILLLAALLLFLYMVFEVTHVKVTNIRFSKNRNCLKLVHMSDIHIRLLKVPVKKVIKHLEKIRPDVVILTGDYIEKEEHIPMFIDFLRQIAGDYKILLSFGNHDYHSLKDTRGGIEAFAHEIRKVGVTVMQNSSLRMVKNSREYNFIGIDDLRAGTPDVEAAFSSAGISKNADRVNIAFSHNPDLVFDIPPGKADFFLCGHFHGGQIWAPFKFEFRFLREDKLCHMGKTRGAHRINGMTVYINRGLGNVLVPLRFMSRPEITVLYI